MTAPAHAENSTTVRAKKTRPSPAIQTLSAVLRTSGPPSPGIGGDLCARPFLRAPPPRPTAPAEQAILDSGELNELHDDGETLRFVEWGEGRAVILLHGWGGSAAQMTPLVGTLLERGFRVQAIDAPGHGESTG